MTGLCTTSYCPAKADVDWHRCFVCDAPNVEHHHVKPRGMGGSKKRRDDPLNVVALCRPHHEMVTLHECSDDILDHPGRGKFYVYFDLHGNTLIERVLSTKEESDGDELVADSSGVAGMGIQPEPPDKDIGLDIPPVPRGDGAGVHSLTNRPPLTHEQRVAIAQDIKDTEWNRQWIAGDTGNQWIAELGESAEQYLSDFGYVHESLANILRVCAAIPEEIRRDGLRFSHHVVMLGLNREDMEMWLDKCEEEQWSVAEFRRQVKGTKPRVKRWSLEELREVVGDFENDVGDEDNARDFLDYLEEQA